MPKGFAGVRAASAEVAAKRSTGSGPSAMFFKLADGQEAEVRFLEQDDDVAYCYVHYVPIEGRAWGKPVTCLDQDKDGTPCPGCERGMDRKFLGYINLIWFNAPVFKRGEDGKTIRDGNGDLIVIGEKPQIGVWSSGIRVFEELDEINTNFRGLRSRRFKIKRKGERLSTKYSIGPVDVDSGPQPWTDEEKRLEAEKEDLQLKIVPGSYEDFMRELGLDEGNPAATDGERVEQAARKNPFKAS